MHTVQININPYRKHPRVLSKPLNNFLNSGNYSAPAELRKGSYFLPPDSLGVIQIWLFQSWWWKVNGFFPDSLVLFSYFSIFQHRSNNCIIMILHGCNFVRLIMIITLAILLECLAVTFAGFQVKHYDHLIELSEQPDYKGRSADDLVKYYIVFYFMWFLSQGLAIFAGITLLIDRMNPENRTQKYLFLLIGVLTILAVKWILQPWYIGLKGPAGPDGTSEIDRFRLIMNPYNIIIASVLVIMDINSKVKKADEAPPEA